jgi:hypothetical protein
MNSIKIRDYDYTILKELSRRTKRSIPQLLSEIIADKISTNIDRELSKLHRQNSY